MSESRPMHYREDVPLVRQRRWYIEALVLATILALFIRLNRGLLGWSWSAVGGLVAEAVAGAVIVLAVTGAAHAWRIRR